VTKPWVHETAIVEDGAVVGDGTKVWHHAHVRSGARIGTGCSLGKNVFVNSGAVIGDRVRIQNNVSVYDGITLHDDVMVGPSAVFTNDRFPRAHGFQWEVTPTIVEQGATVGGGAVIVCGVTLGAWSMAGAGAVVTRSVGPHQVVVGNPARHYGWACWCGKVTAGEARPTSVCDRCGLEFGGTRAP
jgi:UDP-2-acetamido-3-amino-2,3-dideoxy-glucuronate N-acetyltransferase